MLAFARIVVREDGGLILGKNFHGLLKPNTVYEITEILGEFVIIARGPSQITAGRPTWNHDANTIIEDGSYLYTVDEYSQKCAQATGADTLRNQHGG